MLVFSAQTPAALAFPGIGLLPKESSWLQHFSFQILDTDSGFDNLLLFEASFLFQQLLAAPPVPPARQVKGLGRAGGQRQGVLAGCAASTACLQAAASEILASVADFPIPLFSLLNFLLLF